MPTRVRGSSGFLTRALVCGLLASLAIVDTLADGVEADLAAGSAALRAGRLVEAEATFVRVVAARPTDPEVWLKLGMARSALGNHDGAIEAYERSLSLEPSNAKAQNNIANIHFRRGELELAARAYEKALALQPHYLLALYHYGFTLRQLNRPGEAERAFSGCVAERPENDRERQTQLECFFYTGALRARAEDWPGAASIMKQVIATDPNHADAHYYLGMAYRRLGRDAESRVELARHKELLRAKRRTEAVTRGVDP